MPEEWASPRVAIDWQEVRLWLRLGFAFQVINDRAHSYVVAHNVLLWRPHIGVCLNQVKHNSSNVLSLFKLFSSNFWKHCLVFSCAWIFWTVETMDEFLLSNYWLAPVDLLSLPASPTIPASGNQSSTVILSNINFVHFTYEWDDVWLALMCPSYLIDSDGLSSVNVADKRILSTWAAYYSIVLNWHTLFITHQLVNSLIFLFELILKQLKLE